jgi:hypothetical protein
LQDTFLHQRVSIALQFRRFGVRFVRFCQQRSALCALRSALCVCSVYFVLTIAGSNYSFVEITWDIKEILQSKLEMRAITNFGKGEFVTNFLMIYTAIYTDDFPPIGGSNRLKSILGKVDYSFFRITLINHVFVF